jgi:hypothetical protein
VSAFEELYRELLSGARENARIANTGVDRELRRPDEGPEAFESMTRKNCAQAALALTQALVTLRKAARER